MFPRNSPLLHVQRSYCLQQYHCLLAIQLPLPHNCSQATRPSFTHRQRCFFLLRTKSSISCLQAFPLVCDLPVFLCCKHTRTPMCPLLYRRHACFTNDAPATMPAHGFASTLLALSHDQSRCFEQPTQRLQALCRAHAIRTTGRVLR